MHSHSQNFLVKITRSILCSWLCFSTWVMAQLESQPLNSPGEIQSGSLFRKMSSDETGISFKNLLKDENIVKYLYNGAGLCTGDYDNDGLPDIYLVSQDGENKLYRQVATWRFEDVTDIAGVDGGDTWGAGSTFVDIDNDGDLDLYVCNVGSVNLLYINQGNGTFTEEAARWNLNYDGATYMAAFADYDRDGDLDCYLLNYRLFGLGQKDSNLILRKIGGEYTVHPDYVGVYNINNQGGVEEAGQKDRLFRNNGDRTFTDVSYISNIGQDYYHGLSATWWDYNNDGWLDLYVANDFKDPDQLYKNNGDGTFTDMIKSSVAYTSWFAMGGDFGDINNDGLFDYLVADMSATDHYKQKTSMGDMDKDRWFLESAEPRQYMRNTLQLNTGIGRFMEIGTLAGVESTNWTWSARFADLDNDGLEDAFFASGIERNFRDSDFFSGEANASKKGLNPKIVHQQTLELPRFKEVNRAFRNQGDLTFEEVSSTWGLDDSLVSHGASFVDMDRDGDLDLLVNNMNDSVSIYRNKNTAGERILVRLQGRQSNSFGIGTRVTAITKLRKQSRIMTLARGYLSADEPVISFGFGSENVIQRLIVNWPSGAQQEFYDLLTDRVYTITEPEGVYSPVKPKKRSVVSQFRDITEKSGLRHRHQENEFDDYEVQPLLPFKMSQLGPGMAWGDCDGDGDEDVYVGGALDQSGALFIQQAAGQFERMKDGPWDSQANYEDMGALWFDADADGDLDLYVVSGGFEPEQGSSELRDRLYLNKGGNEFEDAQEEMLPSLTDSGSVVAGADFDRDGDVDLFVGSRLIPKRYPFSSGSHLLANTNGKFTDSTKEHAPGLTNCGAVTGAIWSDIDNDHWIDLVITTEWGSIKVFKNFEGRLADETKFSGLAQYKGLWNGIAAGDLDNDGDMDFIATNLGLNSKYKVTIEKPLHLYASDFDNNGILDLVEASWEEATLYPVRGKSCSANAMPFVGEKFKTFEAFAQASLEDVYTVACLSQSKEFTANYLESSVLVNLGSGKFEVRPLPVLAQVAPGYGVVLDDLNGDGDLDVVLAQNFYSPQPETGRLSGGLSLLLEGNGDCTFSSVWPKESGISVHEDAKSLAVVDIDGDQTNDLVFGINDGPLRVYKNSSYAEVKPFTINLTGPIGNTTAFGARVIVKTSKERVIHREVYAGSGYLSQSSSQLNIALKKDDSIRSITVFWPDGEKGKFDSVTTGNIVMLRHPSIELASSVR